MILFTNVFKKKVSIELVHIYHNDECILDFFFCFLDLMTSTFTSGKFLTKAKAIQSLIVQKVEDR
jgi:hypothetical protein